LSILPTPDCFDTTRNAMRRLPMRRLCLALLFPLLLIAQQGAFVHSLEHVASGAGPSSTRDERHSGANPYCEKCFAFAQIGAAAGLAPALAAAVHLDFGSIGFRLPIAPLSQVHAPRSRGPPSLLQ
jgi:hypothetical protein